MKNELMWLNAGNETSMIQMLILEQLKLKFPNEELIGLEVGSTKGDWNHKIVSLNERS